MNVQIPHKNLRCIASGQCDLKHGGLHSPDERYLVRARRGPIRTDRFKNVGWAYDGGNQPGVVLGSSEVAVREKRSDGEGSDDVQSIIPVSRGRT